MGQSVSGAEKRLEKASAYTVAKIDTAAPTAAKTVFKRLAQASQHLAHVNDAADRTEVRAKNAAACYLSGGKRYPVFSN